MSSHSSLVEKKYLMNFRVQSDYISNGYLFVDPSFLDELVLQHFTEIGVILKSMLELVSRPRHHNIYGEKMPAFSLSTYEKSIDLIQEILVQAKNNSSKFPCTAGKSKSETIKVSNVTMKKAASLSPVVPPLNKTTASPIPEPSASGISYRDLTKLEEKSYMNNYDMVISELALFTNFNNDKCNQISMASATR